MKPSGPAHERETIIRFSDESAQVTVWTASGKVYRKLMLLGFQRTQDGERHGEFACTLKNVRFTKGRKLTEEQRLATSQRLQQARKSIAAAKT